MHIRRPTFLAATFVVAALLDPGGPVAQAQYEPIWSIGDQSIHFGTVDEPGLTVNDLPEPNDAEVPMVAQYQGAIAQRSQYAHYDQNGDLLFFIVDGNIYNGNGYLIADRAMDAEDRNCRDCFYPGQEVHVYPVPGSCTRFFVFSLFSVEESGGVIEPPGLAASSSYSMIRLGVLDLSIANSSPAFDNTDCIIRGGFMDQTDQGGANFYMLSNMQSTPDYITSNWDEGNDPRNALVEASMHGSSANGMLRAGTIQLAGDQRGLAVVRTPQNLITLLIEASGVRRLDTEGGASSYPMEWLDFPTELPPLNSIADGDQTFRGEMALRQVGNELRVAYSAYFIWPDINDGPLHQPRVAYWSFQLFEPTDENPTSLGFTMVPLDQPGANPKTYTPDSYPINTTTPPLDFAGNPIDRPTIGGLEFSPNGRYLYFTKSAQGTDEFPTTNFGYIDLTVPCGTGQPCLAWTFLDIGGPLEARKLADTQLGINIGPNGITPALYMLGADAVGDYWLASFTDPDFPASGLWTQQTVELSDIAFRTAADGTTQYRLLNKRVSASRHYETIQQEVCCEELVRMKDQSRTTDVGHQVWLPGDNPMCNATTSIYIATELRIPAGSSIIANDLEFRFAEGATMIVERGGRFVSNGCTFTSACDERWAGIRVEGKRNNPVQTQTGSPVNERQGWLYLTNSAVANAEIGVLCGRLTDPESKLSMYNGGVVRASGTTFRNCITGVNIPYYKRMNGSLELDNLSNFSGCDFLTDLDWPAASNAPPMYHAWLSGVRGITFSQCRFRNDEPTAFGPYQRGWGIFAYQAGFNVLGNDDPDDSVFENLHIGIVSAPGPTKTYAVDRMHFQNNMWGIYDMGSTAGRIIRNTFLVPDQGEFLQPTVGLLLHESSAYIVEENDFAGDTKDRSVGIYFLGPQQADNRIYNNTFTQLLAGTLVYGRHKGNEIGFELQGLEILCGDYLDNIFDYALAEYTYIKENQGQINSLFPSESQLAGNRWLDPADLTSTFDIWIDPEQHTGTDPVFPVPSFDYKRHDVPECDPLNISPYFVDEVQTDFDDFEKESACGNGNLQPPPAPPNELYTLTAAQLISAISHFNGTVNDGGEQLDLGEAITQQPPLASHVLRDYLLAHTPLHDDIMIAMLERATPMDAWHATQVLLANCKLTNKVWRMVQRVEYLTPYQLGLIESAPDGSQALQLLRQEVALRSAQKARLQTHVMHAMLSDSTTGHRLEAIWDLIGTTPDVADEFYIADLHLWGGEEAVVDAWLDSMETKSLQKVYVLRELLQLRQSTPDSWPEPQVAHGSVLTMTKDELEAGSAAARAMGYQGQLIDDLPPVLLPDPTKSRTPQRRSTNAEYPGNTALEVYPNPTNGLAYLVLPKDMSNVRTVTVRDALGRTVQEVVNGNGALLIELDLRTLANGVYSCDVTDGNMSKGYTLITVKH